MLKIKRTFGFIFNHPLAKKHLLSALYRFLVWQLQSVITPNRFIIKKFIGSVRFVARRGLTGITGNIYTGLHEFNDMAFLLHFLHPEDLFVDVGANAGSYSLLASGMCRADTIAFEPFAGTAAILQKNIALNGLQNKITVVNAAAGAQAGTAWFSTSEDTTNHVLTDNEINKINQVSVRLTTVDEVTVMQRPRLIKVDAEGFETEVLRGMNNTLQDSDLKAIIIELNGSGGRYGFDEQDIHKKLMDCEFKPYQYEPFTRKFILLDTFGAYNTIYCRDIDWVTCRVKEAAPFKIFGEHI